MVVSVRTAGELAPAYDAIVVGSGYGSGVAASRLSRLGLRVAVVEQGRLWRPGDFPTTTKARCKALRLTGRAPTIGDPTGLYYLSVGRGLTVFGASGLGGGSLINAGVVLRPDPQRLRECGWPDEVLSDGLLDKGIWRAEAMLGANKVPQPERFAKYNGMWRAAATVGRSVQSASMTIAHRPGYNAAGVMQYACRYCGDCWSGCNVGAKNTIGITYIPDAVDHGAEVFCESRVEAITKVGESWQIVVRDLANGGATRKVDAGTVILGAGTLGTNELLLRAQRDGLPLSPQLGQKFSANGDDLVFATELDKPVHAVATGFPSQAPRGARPVGPHSMAIIDLSDESGPLRVHDGTMLTVMAGFAPFHELLRLKIGTSLRILRGGAHGEELSRTQVYYIVSQDDASGRLVLHKDRVCVEWRDYSGAPARLAAEEKVKAMVEQMGGKFQPNPFALTTFGGNRVIAHPLGGCAMGDTVDDGVIAHDGRVFDPTRGPRAVHEGLYVVDGASIPSAIGVSPLLTITALAERAMMLFAERYGRTLDVQTGNWCEIRDAAM